MNMIAVSNGDNRIDGIVEREQILIVPLERRASKVSASVATRQ